MLQIILVIFAVLAPTASSRAEATLFRQVQFRGGPNGECPNGYDFNIRNGRCYPNGVLPPQYQVRPRYEYRGARYPVPCGNGADVDIRDGQCYPNGTVPRRFQQGRQGYY
jgi:hypothetical protein